MNEHRHIGRRAAWPHRVTADHKRKANQHEGEEGEDGATVHYVSNLRQTEN